MAEYNNPHRALCKVIILVTICLLRQPRQRLHLCHARQLQLVCIYVEAIIPSQKSAKLQQ